MTDNTFLSEIKSGDRVWIGWMYRPKNSGIRTVSKVTPTQIVIDWNGNGSYFLRFRREDGYRIGGSRFHWDKITGIATAAECSAWDAAQKRKANAEQIRLALQDARLKRQRELASLIGYGCPTVEIHEKSMTLTISELTEADVLSIARKLEGPEVKP